MAVKNTLVKRELKSHNFATSNHEKLTIVTNLQKGWEVLILILFHYAAHEHNLAFNNIDSTSPTIKIMVKDSQGLF